MQSLRIAGDFRRQAESLHRLPGVDELSSFKARSNNLRHLTDQYATLQTIGIERAAGGHIDHVSSTTRQHIVQGCRLFFWKANQHGMDNYRIGEPAGRLQDQFLVVLCLRHPLEFGPASARHQTTVACTPWLAKCLELSATRSRFAQASGRGRGKPCRFLSRRSRLAEVTCIPSCY